METQILHINYPSWMISVDFTILFRVEAWKFDSRRNNEHWDYAVLTTLIVAISDPSLLLLAKGVEPPSGQEIVGWHTPASQRSDCFTGSVLCHR